MVFETEFSDFSQNVCYNNKMYYSKQKPTIIHYHKPYDFSNKALIEDFKALYQNNFMRKRFLLRR